MTTLSRLRRVIAEIPRGKVATYGQVADRAGFPGAARATVWALQRGDGLPWHRVVGAGGRIALSGEEGREQRLRLELEGVTFRRGRVRMDLHAWKPRRRAAVPPPRARRSPRGRPTSAGRMRPTPDPTDLEEPVFDPRPRPFPHDRWTESLDAPQDR
ncbi:MAG TPA: MGMT family protein [Thermoplasmata archaeon]|nr:MGMT family protein [Thermoplasmata archaeon]